MTKDEMVAQHHYLYGHEFEQILKDSEGQGSLECCIPWGCKELDMTESDTWAGQQQKGSNQSVHRQNNE